jgi:hypothetical protein
MILSTKKQETEISNSYEKQQFSNKFSNVVGRF